MTFLKPNFWDKKKISLFAILLIPISLFVRFLNFLNRNLSKKYIPTLPSICVGNIYLGGTGKTPLCIEIFLILKSLDMKPSFIRKQYNAFEDEVILQKKIGPVYENKKRLSAIKLAYENGSNIAILDDGFQDYSLKKNLSIICFNEKQWIGNGLVIPSGPLREDISALKRADCVVINGKKNTSIEKTILDQNKNIKIYYSKYNPKNIDSFKNKKVVAFAGIGNPQNFFNLLKNYNLNPIKEIKFPDHYNYSSKDLEKLLSISKENDAILLTTEKDYFRIIEHYKKNINFIKIELEIENKDLFIEEIKKII